MNILRPISAVVKRLRGKKEPIPHKEPDPGQGFSNANARGWLADILTHHWAESLEIDRIGQAKGYGMPAGERVSKFAGQSSVVNNHGGGFFKGAIATLLAGGLAAAGVAGWPLMLAGLGVNAVTHQKETVIEPEEFLIDIEAKDGRLVPTGVRKAND